MSEPGPVEGSCGKMTVQIEKREPSMVVQMLASGLGSIIGGELAGALRWSPLGRAFGSLAGALVGHCAVTYRIVLGKKGESGTSPMAVSDRR